MLRLLEDVAVDVAVLGGSLLGMLRFLPLRHVDESADEQLLFDQLSEDEVACRQLVRFALQT